MTILYLRRVGLIEKKSMADETMSSLINHTIH